MREREREREGEGGRGWEGEKKKKTKKKKHKSARQGEKGAIITPTTNPRACVLIACWRDNRQPLTTYPIPLTRVCLDTTNTRVCPGVCAQATLWRPSGALQRRMDAEADAWERLTEPRWPASPFSVALQASSP